MKKFVGKGFCLIAISFLLFQCVPKRERPVDILPEEQMKSIFYDLYLLEGSERANIETIEGERFLMFETTQSILTRHGTTEDQFQKSIEYYAWDTEQLNLIIKDVVEELNKKEAEMIGQPSSD